MKASTLRKNVAATITSWEDAKQGSATHKKIVDIYNKWAKAHNLALAQTSYYWCDITASAAWIENDMGSYVPISMSCGGSINIAKQLGIWEEKDTICPAVGDGIIYDWSDTSGTTSDNKSGHDHIGIVISVAKDKKSFVVMEGNMGSPSHVGRRTVPVNWKYIRGFIRPDYTAAAKAITKAQKKKDTTTTTTTTPAPKETSTKIVQGAYAQHYSSALAGKYKVTATDGLNLRYNAGTKYKLLKTLKYKTTVTCYGYYNLDVLTKWLYVTYTDTATNTTYCGYMHSKWLQKV